MKESVAGPEGGKKGVDEVDFTELLAAKLEESGFDVRQINDPTTAIPAAESFRPDFCVIDHVMSRMDGGDVVNVLKAEPGRTSTPVLITARNCAP